MNKIWRRNLIKFSSNALVLLITVVLASAGAASAKEHKAKKAHNEAEVVAHISFSGLAEVDMTMQKRANDKRYLYVQHSKDQGISVVDVSEPARAKVVGVIPWPNPAVSSRMNLTGNLAIIAESEVLPIHDSTSKDDLVLWDLSNPVAARVVQKFSGVVTWFQDERNFLYVLNEEGLWIVSEASDPQPEPIDASLYN